MPAQATKWSTKGKVREAVAELERADAALEAIRDHYDFECGEHGYCDLDLALGYAMLKMEDARKELNGLLDRFPKTGIPLDFPKGRSWV